VLDVRISFLESFYYQGTLDILNKNRRYFVDLLKTTENFYGVGRANQQDVLLAKLELSRLDDRINQVINLLEINKAMLSKWVPSAQQQNLAQTLPVLNTFASLQKMEQALIKHPMVHVDDALVAAAKQNVSIAEEQYKPGFNVGVEYRKRFGDELNGQHRADMVAAMMTVELPIFPEKRQDKRLSASQHGYQAAKLKRLDNLRNMRQKLHQHVGNWNRLTQRLGRYQTYLLKQAAENTKAALRAYQSGVADFSTLLQARITELETRIQRNRIAVNKAKAQAQVLFYSVNKQ
jgi:outer membrane protein TolC